MRFSCLRWVGANIKFNSKNHARTRPAAPPLLRVGLARTASDPFGARASWGKALPCPFSYVGAW